MPPRINWEGIAPRTLLERNPARESADGLELRLSAAYAGADYKVHPVRRRYCHRSGWALVDPPGEFRSIRMNGMAIHLFEYFNARDADGLGDLLSADVKHLAPGSEFGVDVEGREALVRYFAENVFPKFRNIEFKPWKIYHVKEAGTEIVEWRGQFVTKDGVTFQSRGVFVLEHDGSQIFRMREYFDTEKTRAAFESGMTAQP